MKFCGNLLFGKYVKQNIEIKFIIIIFIMQSSFVKNRKEAVNNNTIFCNDSQPGSREEVLQGVPPNMTSLSFAPVISQTVPQIVIIGKMKRQKKYSLKVP